MCFRWTRIRLTAISRFKLASRQKGQFMDWFGAGGNGALIVVRAIHFAATAITTGALVFRAVVARPALDSGQAVARLVRTQTLIVAWIGLAIAVASGMA